MRHQLARRARRLPLILTAAAVLVLAPATWNHARADHVDELSRTLVRSAQHKERIGAAVSLGRLKDPRAMGALIKALDDQHRTVRAVAAVALGNIGDLKAMPALERATKDPDELVRKRAEEAIAAIRRHDQAAKAVAASSTRTRSHKSKRRPTAYIELRSAADKSQISGNGKARLAHTEAIRRFITAELASSAELTTSTQHADKLGVNRFGLDASVVSFQQRRIGSYVEVECEVRLAVSDARGKMLSFMTGKAKVMVPRSTFKSSYLPGLRIEAMEGAVKSVHQDLLVYLRRYPSS